MNHAIRNKAERVRDFVEMSVQRDDVPGVQYVVVSADSVVFSHSAGLADISGQRKMDSSTTMMTYSMTKTFTAAAVLQLAELQKISLEDPLSAYVPDTPYGSQIRIRHLLCQTSGIPNPIPLSWVHLLEEHLHYDERSTLAGVIADHPVLDHTPGEKYSYSNISYWLLGKVIEKASGLSYEDYVRWNVFDRLGLSPHETGFLIPDRSRHAKGYLPRWSFMNLVKSFLIDSKYVGAYEDGWLHINEHYLNGPAFGGIVSSARMIGIFLQDQLCDDSRVFGAEAKSLFYQQQQNNDGMLIPMTLGWHIGELYGIRYFFKEGGGGGFHCEMRIYPHAGIGSVVIGNSATFDAGKFLSQADEAFFMLGGEEGGFLP